MKIGHALGFLSVGLVMLALPLIAPGLCPRNGFDGSSGRELWLFVMGTLQVALGGSVCAWNTASAAIALWETLPEAIAGVLEHATVESEQMVDAMGDVGLVAFELEAEADWSERRAA